MIDPLNIKTPFASEAERQTAQRDEVDWKNRQELLRLVAEKDLWIRKEDFDSWRPTVRENGEIPGVKEGLTIIATDGNLAFYECVDDFDVFFGHIQCFTGEVKTLFAMPKEGVVKEASKKEKRHVRDAMELLKEIRARFA